MKIINKYYNLKELNKKIVLISDIHYYDKKDIKLLNAVLERISKIKPDYICIPGDITDISNISDEDEYIDWFKNLSKISKIIITLGNHEYYIRKSEKKFGINEKFLSKLKRIDNVYLLRNESKSFDGINFIGIDLGIDYYYDEYNSNINIRKYILKDDYNVLLCHSPVDIDKIVNNNDVNLVLCGHMHGGVVPRILRPIFKNSGIISPTKRLFPKYAYGLKIVGNSKVVTTSGIRIISRINKFYLFTNFFHSEIVILKKL